MIPAAPVGEPSRWRYRRSLASRVIVLTTMAVGIAVAAIAFASFLTARMQMQSTLDESLVSRAYKVAEGIRIDSTVPAWALEATDVEILYMTSDARYVSFDQDSKIKLGAPEYAVASGAEEISIRTVVASDGEHFRVVAVPAQVPGQSVMLAQSLAPQQQNLAKLGAVMLVLGVTGVVIAAAAGWLVARNGLRPVRRLTTEVEEIARTEDLHPLPVEGDDEIARLATAFNAMLLALAASRDRQRQLVADAGHELRTPLTSLRTNLDLLAQAGADLPEEARAELIDDVRAQIAELTQLVGDLVELARDDQLSPVVEEVDLSDVVDRALSRVRRRAGAIVFDVSLDGWLVTGDAAALERAITNLLDNAVKWSPADGTVTVRLADGVLVVDDQGPGIADADLPHVFDRFWRSEESRAMPGSGLGLAIVDQVVSRHSGVVTAGAAPGGGARLELRIPGRPGVSGE